MKTRLLTLLFVVVMVGFASAQDYAFKVLANKGTNEVKSGEGWIPLKAGSSLKSTDEVKLSDNCYVGLVHSSGKPVELKKPGSYSVLEIEKMVPKGTSVLSKYTDFILSSNSAEAKKNRLSATGAVHRELSQYAIQLMLPENQHSGIFNTAAVINWAGTSVPGPYVVTLNNMFDDELAKFETNETSFQVDLSDPKFVKENAIMVEVKSKSDPKLFSKQHLIKKLTPSDVERVKTSLNEIIGDLSEQTAMNKILLASFYEENNLFIDAIKAYEDAIKLAPDVDMYKEYYEEFLLRHGMKH